MFVMNYGVSDLTIVLYASVENVLIELKTEIFQMII